MNLRKPILTKWQKGPMAAFIRRHRWFFRISGDSLNGYVSSFYTIIFIYIPMISAAYVHAPWNLIVIALSFMHMAIAFVLVDVALEKSR
jgi:hypothetical protein